MASKPPNQQFSNVLDQQERIAREYLAQGRLRKARDEFKQLCKLDRPRFLPLLVETNIQLVLEMNRKGMVGEARQLVDYLRTIATPEQMLALELELGLKPSGCAPEGVLGVILTKLAGPSLKGLDRERLADQAVLLFEPLSNPRAELTALAGELEAVLTALQAVSQNELGRAGDAIRPLGQASAFAHWKVFIKGLCAFHLGEREKARRSFAGVPSGTVPGKTSQAYLLLLGALPLCQPSISPPEPVVEAACQLVAYPGCGEPLWRAEQDWRAGKVVKMYQGLRKGIPNSPAGGLSLVGLLSEFASNCFFSLPDKPQLEYAQMIHDILRRKPSGHEVERELLLRVIVVAGVNILPVEALVSEWQEFIRLREKLHGPDPVLASMACGWLGQALQVRGEQLDPRFGFFPSRRGTAINSQHARRLLETAVQADPANLSAALSLCKLYEEQRCNSERNRLLDEMGARFPTDKNVLLLAARGCVDRRAFKKGLDYLNQARLSDGLDPTIPDRLAEANILHAADQFQKGRIAPGREAMRWARSVEVQSPDNLARAHWCLSVQHGLMESLWGVAERGQELLDEARQSSPSAAAFLFYAGLKAQDLGPRTGRAKDFFFGFEELARKSANGADAVMLTRIWQHGTQRTASRAADEPKRLLDRYLLAAAKRPCSREAAAKLVEFGLADKSFADAASAIVEARLALDKKDPQFRLLRLRLEAWAMDDEAELEDILEEAARRKDEHTVRQARKQLDALHHAPPPPPFPDLVGGGPDYRDFQDDEEETSDPDGIPLTREAILRDLPPYEAKLIKGLLDMLASASPRELKDLKETMPGDLHGLDFEALLEIARGKPAAPPPRPPPIIPRKPSQKRIEPPDPNQLGLF